MASSADRGSAKVTKAKPLELPLYLSTAMLTSSRAPNFENMSSRSALVCVVGILATKSLVPSLASPLGGVLDLDRDLDGSLGLSLERDFDRDRDLDFS